MVVTGECQSRVVDFGKCDNDHTCTCICRILVVTTKKKTSIMSVSASLIWRRGAYPHHDSDLPRHDASDLNG